MKYLLFFLMLLFVSFSVFAEETVTLGDDESKESTRRYSTLRGYNQYDLDVCKEFEGQPLSAPLSEANGAELYDMFFKGQGILATELARSTVQQTEKMISCLSGSRCGDTKRKFIEESQNALTQLRVDGLLLGMDHSFLKSGLDNVDFEKYRPTLRLPDQQEMVSSLTDKEQKQFFEVGQSILLEAEERTLSPMLSRDSKCIRVENGLHRLKQEPLCKLKYQKAILNKRASVLQHRQQSARDNAHRLFLKYPWLKSQKGSQLNLDEVRRQLQRQNKDARNMVALYQNANSSQLLQLIDYPEISNAVISAQDNTYIREAFCSFYQTISLDRARIQRNLNRYVGAAALAGYALCPFTLGAGCIIGAMNSAGLAGLHIGKNAVELVHAQKLHSANIITDEDYRKRQTELVNHTIGMGITVAVGGFAISQSIKFIPPPVLDAVKEAPKAVARVIEKQTKKVAVETRRLTKAERRIQKQVDYDRRKAEEAAADAGVKKRRQEGSNEPDARASSSSVAAPTERPLRSMFSRLPERLPDDALSHWSSPSIRAKFRKHYEHAINKASFQDTSNVKRIGPCLVIRGNGNQRLILRLATGEPIFSGNHNSYDRFWPTHCKN